MCKYCRSENLSTNEYYLKEMEIAEDIDRKTDLILYFCENREDVEERVKNLLLEIERLNKRVKECEEAYLRTRHQYSELETKYIIDEYIINNFEKWLTNEIKRLENIQNPKKGIKPYGEEYNHYTLLIGAYDNSLDKLRELKGDSSNGNK